MCQRNSPGRWGCRGLIQTPSARYISQGNDTRPSEQGELCPRQLSGVRVSQPALCRQNVLGQLAEETIFYEEAGDRTHLCHKPPRGRKLFRHRKLQRKCARPLVIAIGQSWDAYSSAAWARALGLVDVPMFAAPGKDDRTQPRAQHAVLLDGDRGSFAFTSTSDVMFAQELALVSWAWSSHVRHVVVAVDKPRVLYIRRWDAPSLSQPLELPETREEAERVLAAIESAPPPQKTNAVQYVLHIFRQIRELPECAEAECAVRLLNAMLLAVESAREDNRTCQVGKVSRAATFGELVACLSQPDRELAEVQDLPASVRNQGVGPLVVELLRDVHGLTLRPSLLLRHASSRLYQEAHLEIERSRQMAFPGMAPVAEPEGPPPKDVRFTPTNLARALVQQALLALGALPMDICALDPACGSGVFLQEFLKEMSLRGMSGKARIVGYDISGISVCMSRFCLNAAARDFRNADVSVHLRDSLKERCWAKADIILMNPPFVSWSALSEANQHLVRETLGDMSGGRPDIAMAFVWNAIMSLKPGGILACVLPAALLSSKSGKVWRDRIQGEGEVVVLGRFEGYRYFPTSIVETSFLVFRRKRATGDPQPQAAQPVQVLVAREGYEDASLRALRLKETDPRRKTDEVQVFEMPLGSLSVDSWRPQREETYRQLDLLRSQHRAVQDLFKIRQGIRVGGKSAFLLSATEYRDLPKRERKFFRPSVGTITLQDGHLLRKEFLFYPYGEQGLQITSEKDLERLVPRYYKRWLLPRKDNLSRRPRKKSWWELSEHRAWQIGRDRHIVSTYFGKRGCFAYNSTGDFVVVNGHAWIWKGDQREYQERLLPWAYLALLNSEAFERILSWTSLPLRGGQFRLEKRFLADVPLPDLSDDTRYSDATVQELVALGRAIGKGRLREVCGEVDHVASSLLIPAENPPA